MSLTIDTEARQLTADERKERLDAVGGQWVATIQESPQKAALVFGAEGEGFGSVATRLSSGGHSYVIDEPAGLGGDDLAANPVETALGALIACQVVTYRVWAHNLGIAVDDVRIAAEGDLDVRGFFGLDEGTRPGFGDIRLTVTVTGPETAERYRELHDAVDAHCPVLDLFSNPTPVSTTLVVG